jgi:hypothetical protein
MPDLPAGNADQLWVIHSLPDSSGGQRATSVLCAGLHGAAKSNKLCPWRFPQHGAMCGGEYQAQTKNFTNENSKIVIVM